MREILNSKMATCGKLEGATIYRERSDCKEYKLDSWNVLQQSYNAISEDGESDMLQPCDLIGDYIVSEKAYIITATSTTGYKQATATQLNEIEKAILETRCNKITFETYTIHVEEYDSEEEATQNLDDYSTKVTHSEIEDLEELTPLQLAVVELFGESELTDTLEMGWYLHTDITNDTELGEYWIYDSGCYDLEHMGVFADYIDAEAFGKDIEKEAEGGFTTYGWLRKI